MNGEAVRSYKAEVTLPPKSRVTIFSLKDGTRLDLENGMILDVTLDEFGNEYAMVDGQEHFVGGKVTEMADGEA